MATQVHATCNIPPIASDTLVPAAAVPVVGIDGVQRWRERLTRREEPVLMPQQARPDCQTAPAPPTLPAPAENGYVKQTEFDNTPYRFNMIQDGRRMSADDFDAWLEANGYSVGRRILVPRNTEPH